MDVSAAFVTHREAAIAIEPGQRALDHPAMPPQSLTRFDATSSEARDDATLATGDAT